MKRKWYLLLALVAVLVLALSACGKGTTTTPAVTTTSTSSSTTTSVPPASTSTTTTSTTTSTTTTRPPTSTTSSTTSTTTTTTPPTSTTTSTTATTTTTTTQTGVRYGGTLKIVLTGPVAAIGTLGSTVEYIAGMYTRVAAPAMEYLFTYDADERFMPMLAESWDFGPEGKTLTIHLRKGVKFQDGTTFNAPAVKEVFDMMKVATNSPTLPAIFKNVTSYDVLDDYTIRVNFKVFDYNFMVNMSLQAIFSPTAQKKATTPENLAKDHMVGTGPFVFAGYARGDYINYTKFNGYWQQGKPYLDAVRLQQIDDPVTSVVYFKTGEAQLIFGITPRDAVSLASSGYNILKSSANVFYQFTPDGANKDSPFADIRVRQALEYAIDRKSIATLGQGYWQPVYQAAAPTDSRYIPSLTPREYNPTKAKQLLAEAGYPTGFKTNLIANNTYNRDVLVACQAYLKAVGIDGAIDMAEAARFADLQNKGWKGLLFSGTPIVGNVQSMFNRFGIQTLPSMYRTTFQQKLDAAQSEPDYDKRLGYLKDMVKIMYDDAMMVPLYSTNDLSASDQRLKGKINWTIGHPNMWYPADAWLSE